MVSIRLWSGPKPPPSNFPMSFSVLPLTNPRTTLVILGYQSCPWNLNWRGNKIKKIKKKVLCVSIVIHAWNCVFLLNLCVVDCQPIRLAASCWNGEGALLFTSSSAPYDCNDNGLCHEVGLKTFFGCSLSVFYILICAIDHHLFSSSLRLQVHNM